MLDFLKNLVPASMLNKFVVAIDLGTSNSVIAFLNEQGTPIVIENEGKQITPSVVAFKNGEIIVGDGAVRQMVLNPHGTIFSAKRFIGRDFSEVKGNGSAWVVPYVVRPGYDKVSAAFEINGAVYDPIQIGAEVLKKLKAAAESYFGKSVSACVITVPAWFNDRQRQATRDAGIIAGFDSVLGVINEPTAAALAYAVEADNEIKEGETILAFDLGGGTMDATVLRLKSDGKNFVETLATNGDISLGGDNFDEILITDIVQKFLKDHSIDLTKTPEAMARVREAAIKLKIDLSSVNQAEIKLPFLVVDENGPKHLEYDLTRDAFEQKISHLVKKAVKIATDCVAAAKLSNKDIDKILLVGGSTRVPLVLRELKSAFGKEPIGNRGVDLIVALGAAVYSGILKESDLVDIEFEDVTALNLGVRTINDVFSSIIKANTKIPCSVKDQFTTTSDDQTEVEVVILQGMDPKASSPNNHILGTLLLEGIEPRRAGEPKIDIEYSLDADGILSVKATDDKGRSIDITLKNASKLDKREIQRMKKESNLAPVDRQELDEARAQLSKEIAKLEKEATSKALPEAKKVTAIAKVEEAGKLLKESLDADQIERKTREIERAVIAIPNA